MFRPHTCLGWFLVSLLPYGVALGIWAIVSSTRRARLRRNRESLWWILPLLYVLSAGWVVYIMKQISEADLSKGCIVSICLVHCLIAALGKGVLRATSTPLRKRR